MTQQELGKAKDEDLKGSLAAIKRAAQKARTQAVRTGTARASSPVGTGALRKAPAGTANDE